MNILIDVLPTTVNIGGVEYPINSGFRTAVLFELMVQDKKISEQSKIENALRLFYPEIPSDKDEAVRKALWFYSRGKERKESRTKNKTALAFKESKAVYSFEKDAELIYAAFMSQYNIDLNAVDMHWWKFSALFDGLSEAQRFCQVMQIRTMKTSGLSQKEIKRINNLKSLYLLEDEEEDGLKGSEERLKARDAKMRDYIACRMKEVNADV